MKLEGSCHCGAVRFALDSQTPYPYMRCYCSICRKTGGGGGYAINIMGLAETMTVEGNDDITTYQVALKEGGVSECRRHFCRRCGSALWVSDPRWPELVHPFASAIDTALPVPPKHVNIMLDFAAPWADIPASIPGDEGETHCPEYPGQSIEAWHKEHRLFGD